MKTKLIGNPKRNKDESMIILVGPKKFLFHMMNFLSDNGYTGVRPIDDQYREDSKKYYKSFVLLVNQEKREFKKMQMNWYKYYHDPKINSLPKLNTYYVPKEYWEVFTLLGLIHHYYWRTQIKNQNVCPGSPAIRSNSFKNIVWMPRDEARKKFLANGKLSRLISVDTESYKIQDVIEQIKEKKLIPLTQSQYKWRCYQWIKQWEEKYGREL